MFSHCALEFFDYRGLETGELFVGHGKTVGFQVRFVSKADEMRDEAQAVLAALQLAEQHILRLNVVRNALQVTYVSRLAQHRGVANDGYPFGIHLAEALNNEIGQAGYSAVVFGLSRFIVEDGNSNVDYIVRFWRRKESGRYQPDRKDRERHDERNRDPPVKCLSRRSADRHIRLGHRGNESEPVLRHRLHKPGIVGGVAQRHPYLRHAIRDAAIEVDMRVGPPHRVAQLVAADHLACPGEQQRERLRGLRLERNDAAVLPELPAVGVEFERAELVDHEPLYSTTRQLMGGINIIGVLKGGLAAALIMNLSQYLLGALVGATGAAPVATIVIRTAALGFATVWLYAAIRPRFGPGPKTAIWAGLIVWALSYVFTAIFGSQSIGSAVVIIAWTGVEMLIASSVGGYLYHES